MLTLNLGYKGKSLTCAHFIAGIPKHEEGYENEYREQSGYDNKPLLMGQLITLTFQKGRETCFWRVPHLIIYGTPYVG